MKESWIAVLALTFAAGAVGSAAAEKTQPPDLTGIWTQYRGSGPGRTDITSIWPRDPPLTKEAKEKVAEYRALVAPTGDTPGGFCLGAGMPASMLGSGGYPMEIIQRPEQITVIYEAHTEIRRIYMNGRKLAEDELIPSRNGYSTGRWEGDTLVVETIGLKEAIDQTSAHSEEAKIIERYRLTEENGQKVLTVEMTLTDPKFYTRPVTVTKKWAAAGLDVRMMLYECNEPAWEDHLEKLRAARKQESKP
jgi:hypothetical protein